MARGFESKDVEFQQDEAERLRTNRRAARSFLNGVARPFQGRGVLSQAERDAELKRREIELSLRRLRGELEHAAHPAHRHMLEGAIADLERRLVSDDGRQ